MPNRASAVAGERNWSRRHFNRMLLTTAGVSRALPADLLSHPAASDLGSRLTPSFSTSKVPVIYSSDLFHPPGDPDDHVDLATLFALPELDIRAVVLDMGERQGSQPGSIPIGQMMALTGRKVPFAAGLGQPLRYPEDKGLNQFSFYQNGVTLILSALREAEGAVFFITTGSVRDIMAAYNRDPELIRRKVARVYVNAGNAGGGDLYWNPGLDPQSYIRLMRSDLPIYWCPCFAGKETLEDLAAGRLGTLQHQTYWKFRQGDVFGVLPKPLQNFFLYALGRKVHSQVDPIAYLSGEPEERLRTEQWRQTRNMWSTASLYHASGRRLYRRGDSWAALGEAIPDFKTADVFDFVPARASINQDLNVRLELTEAPQAFKVFRLLDMSNYQEAMISSLRRLLSEMTLKI